MSGIENLLDLPQNEREIICLEQDLPMPLTQSDIDIFRRRKALGLGANFPWPWLIEGPPPQGWHQTRVIHCAPGPFQKAMSPSLRNPDEIIEELRPGMAYAVTRCDDDELTLTEFEYPPTDVN